MSFNIVKNTQLMKIHYTSGISIHDRTELIAQLDSCESWEDLDKVRVKIQGKIEESNRTTSTANHVEKQ